MGHQNRPISDEYRQLRNEKLIRLKGEGMTNSALALRFGISETVVTKILKGLPTKS